MTRKKLFLATLDIETSDGLKGKEFAVGSFYMKAYNKDIYITDRNEERFFNVVFKWIKRFRIICYIHNEDFDIRFILRYLIDKLDIYPFVIQSNSKILEIRVKEFNCMFRDSYQFLLCSQAEAEKTFLGRQIKKEVNFTELLERLNHENEVIKEQAYKELIERVTTDVKGLYDVILKFSEIYKKHYGINIFYAVTLPTLSLMRYKKMLKKEFGISFLALNPYIEYTGFRSYDWKSSTARNLYYWTREAYFGGLCNVHNLNKLKNVYYYDFVSLYPSVCIMHKMPNPDDYFIMPYITIEYYNKHFKGKHQYIIEARVNENIDFPVLPLRDEESVKFVNGEKKGIWASPEFERFLEFKENEILEIIKIKVYATSEYYLHSYMKECFYNRIEFTEQEDSRALIEKINMNSLTGKFAQKPVRENWVLYNEDLKEDLIFNNQELDIIEFANKYKLLKYQVEILKPYLIPDFSIFITSYSRTYMHKLFYDLKVKNIEVFYYDTDSVFVDKPLELYYPKKIGYDVGLLKNELIKGKYEYCNKRKKYFNKQTKEIIDIPCYKEAKFYLPKVYVTKKSDNSFNIIAKGISTFMIYETIGLPLERNETIKERVKEILNSFEKIEELLFSFGVCIDRYLKYKSSLRRNQSLVSHGEIKKKVQKIYDKREILPNLSTKPLNVEDLEDLKKVRAKNLSIMLNNVKTDYVAYIDNKKQIT